MPEKTIYVSKITWSRLGTSGGMMWYEWMDIQLTVIWKLIDIYFYKLVSENNWAKNPESQLSTGLSQHSSDGGRIHFLHSVVTENFIFKVGIYIKLYIFCRQYLLRTNKSLIPIKRPQKYTKDSLRRLPVLNIIIQCFMRSLNKQTKNTLSPKWYRSHVRVTLYSYSHEQIVVWKFTIPERVSLQYELVDVALVSSSPQRPCHILHIHVLEGHECADASS